MTFIIKTRNEWAATEPKWTKPLDDHVMYVFIGNTRKGRCNDIVSCAKEAQFLQDRDMRYDSDIRFNFLVGGNNVVYECRGWSVRPGLPKRWKKLTSQSIYIGLTGYFRDFVNPWRGRESYIEGYGQVVNRAMWGAVDARGSSPLALPVTNVFTLNLGLAPCYGIDDCHAQVGHFQRRYMETPSKLDIPFNFVITNIGYIYEGRGWNNKPEMPRNYKQYEDKCILIGLFGTPEDLSLTDNMLLSKKKFIRDAMDSGYISKKILMFELQ